jgi:hypothetical protein
MAGSNFSDPKSNDLARSANTPSFPLRGDGEDQSNRPEAGVGGAPDDSATPEAKRAGYGYSFQPEGSAPMGGHNIDARNQYTMKLPRGSSL